MTHVSIAILKQKLSHYIGLVEKGEEVVVTSHRRHVARLVPELGNGIKFQMPTRSLRDLRNIKGMAMPGPTDVVSLLLEDRQRR